MSDFGKAQLLKYGWSEGKGLGKNESGITEALKPKLKFDTTGIGHKDKSWNEWWETAYNKASKNITIETKRNNVSISVSKNNTSKDLFNDNVNEKRSKYATGYQNFQKTSTLLDGNLIEETDIKTSQVKTNENSFVYTPLTDEELFKVCGGRTAHKGARHGLTLNGKLKRIAEQEKALLTGLNTSINTLDKLDSNDNTLLSTCIDEANVSKPSKHTKKKNKRRINDLTHQLNILCNVNDDDDDEEEKKSFDDLTSKKEFKRKRKKGKKAKSVVPNDLDYEKKDKEDDCKSFFVNSKMETDINLEEEIECSEKCSLSKKEKKKSKKRKKQRYQDENIVDISETGDSQLKKLKKSHDSDRKDQEVSLLEKKFKLELYCNEPPVKSQEIRNTSLCQKECNSQFLDTSYKHDSQSRTIKKKKLKHCKKEKIELARITKSIEAGNFDIDTQDSSKGSDNKTMNRKEYTSKSLDTCYKSEADYLNSKLSKKKNAKIRRKEKMNLAELTESLEAVHFGTEESVKSGSTKKKYEAIIDKMVANEIATHKTKCLKKQAKKKKKHKS